MQGSPQARLAIQLVQQQGFPCVRGYYYRCTQEYKRVYLVHAPPHGRLLNASAPGPWMLGGKLLHELDI